MTDLLRCEALRWSTPDGRHVLESVSLAVSPGEIVGLYGPSGVGKTVLGTVLLRLRLAESGVVCWEGRDVTTAPASELRALRPRFQGMLQHTAALLPPWLTVRRALQETSRRVADPVTTPAEADRVIERLGLADLMDRFPRHLSGGEQRRVTLARVLLARPRFAFVDEPDAGLDPLSRTDLLQLLRDAVDDTGLGVLLVTHEQGLMRRFADRVRCLENGRIRDVA